MGKYTAPIAVTSLLGLILALAGCAPSSLVAPALDLTERAVIERPSFTDDDEARMAQENARNFETENEMWDDPLLEAYLTDMLQRLVAVAEPRPFPYRVRVVRDANVNAFTFGGGLIYFNAGLIARMENEAQLASVMAHELVHVTHRHVPRGIERAYTTTLLGDVAMVGATAVGARSGALGAALDKTYEYTMNAAINGHGRAQEAEADEVGMALLVEAGYDPREAAGAFELLLAEYGDQAPVVNFFYGSHPTLVERIERSRALAASRYGDRVAAERLGVNSEEFKRRTRELVVITGVLDYEGKRFNTARAMFEKAAAVWDGDPLPPYYLGKITLETGAETEVALAITHFDAAIAADPAFAPAHRELGTAHYRNGDGQGAVLAFERYLELEPDAEDAERIAATITELKRY
ncbi:MAG: M48 family metalloprotease [Trueperaceae bacterium]